MRARAPRTLNGFPVALLVAGVLSALLVVVAVIALLGRPTSTKPSLVGATITAQSFPRVDGTGSVVTPWTHHHPTLLVFFARWCPVCASEVPRLSRELGAGDLGAVRVLGIDGDSSQGVASTFVRANRVRFPVGLDPVLSFSYGLGLAGYPDAIFVSATGRVVALDIGVLSDRQLRAGLASLTRA